jgi:hypothetical protein
LMLAGCCAAILILYCLIVGVVHIMFPPTLLVFEGDVVAADESGVTFENIRFYGVQGLAVPKGKAQDILNHYRTGDTYTIDLGWYNTHVFSGENYGVSVRYKGGKFQTNGYRFEVTRHFH